MIYLIGSILTSSLVALLFRGMPKFKVDTFQAVGVNYFICFVVGSLLSVDSNIFTAPLWEQDWFPFTIVLGGVFIGVFYAIALTAQQIGVSVSMVAAKMALVIPVLASVILWGDTITTWGYVGIAGALTSVWFTSKKDEKVEKLHWKIVVLPAIVFLGSGFIDSSLKYIQHHHMSGDTDSQPVTIIFGAAFLTALVVMVVRRVKFKKRLNKQSVIAGVILGIPNYFTMYLLVKALDVEGVKTAVVFPINHIGIVMVSTMFSVLIFKEKLSRTNVLGIILAILAIVLISVSENAV